MAQQNMQEIKLKNYSPLRYPGGKSKLAPFVSLVIKKANLQKPVYIEPFAGGAGTALKLLFDGTVSEIVINDYDKAIYSVWKAILSDTERFIDFIENVPLDIPEWRRQKNIYSNNGNRYSFELGLAAFYLNRTNHSGILSAGPIGGYEQKGKYLIDARFNREKLVERIRVLSKYKSKIHIYNKDVRSFINNYMDKYVDNAFVYFDPPYFNKGKDLYKNYFILRDHMEVSKLVHQLQCPWMVTYDNVDEIINLYREYTRKYFDLNYSVANSGKKSEVMFLSQDSLCPTDTELKQNNIRINIRGEIQNDN